MWYTVVFLLGLTSVNGVLVETLFPPIIPFCGCSAIDSCGFQSPCGYSAINYVSDGVDIYTRPFIPDYIYPTSAIDLVTPVCDCSRDRYDLICSRSTIPPLPPVIGCSKYLRQVIIPPPFL